MILNVNQLELSYPEFSLRNVSFQLKKGERVAILGLSGSGKSTLLRAIYGLHNLDSGDVEFDQKTVEGPSKVLIPGDKRMKLVDQNFELDNYHTVQENISNKILHLEKHEIKSKTEELLDVVNLSNHKNQVAQTLSGGQKQRLAIARALAEVPQLLLLDEPFSQIDQMNKFDIEKSLFSYLDQYDITTIMVTHNYQDAFTLTNRILIMKEGEVLNDVDKKLLFALPETSYEAMITGGFNQIEYLGKTINFRRNEFALAPNYEYPIEIEVKVLDILYLGAKYLITLETKDGQELVLENSSEIDQMEKIYLRDKSYQFAR